MTTFACQCIYFQTHCQFHNLLCDLQISIKKEKKIHHHHHASSSPCTCMFRCFFVLTWKKLHERSAKVSKIYCVYFLHWQLHTKSNTLSHAILFSTTLDIQRTRGVSSLSASSFNLMKLYSAADLIFYFASNWTRFGFNECWEFDWYDFYITSI